MKLETLTLYAQFDTLSDKNLSNIAESKCKLLYGKSPIMDNLKNTHFWLLFCLCIVANMHAATVIYTLDNVMLTETDQMTGTFTWTYDVGDFENGSGQFIFLDIPWTSHDHTDLLATFDIGGSIEITLEGSVHDDGVDIKLVLEQPLTPTMSSLLALGVDELGVAQSKYEIGGNGFHTGLIQSGSISPPQPADLSSFAILASGWGTTYFFSDLIDFCNAWLTSEWPLQSP